MESQPPRSIVHTYLAATLAGLVAAVSYHGLQQPQHSFRRLDRRLLQLDRRLWKRLDRRLAFAAALVVPFLERSTRLFCVTALAMIAAITHPPSASSPPKEDAKKESLEKEPHDDDDDEDRSLIVEETLIHTVVPIVTTMPMPPLIRTPIESGKEKYLEIFVHNVSHSDLVLGLEVPSDDNNYEQSPSPSIRPEMQRYARPRFSNFDSFCRLLWQHVQDSADAQLPIVHFPRHQRSMMDLRYSILEKLQQESTSLAPTGLQLSPPVPLLETPLETLRMRGRDAPQIGAAYQQQQQQHGDSQQHVAIRYVFFPLLATLWPVWQRQIQEKEYHQPVKRVLILVTGVGTPRNYTHSIHGNSTEKCADLMKAFLERIDPTLTVVQIHSPTTNIFRSDENILFMQRALLPQIHAYRNAHVLGTPYPDDPLYVPLTDETQLRFPGGTDWRSAVHVTLSLADGSPARTQAIQSALRSYKPTYFHFWQRKTFWHESKIVDDDIEVHSFATMESVPAVDAADLRDRYIQATVAEMRAFYQEMTAALTDPDNDLDRFWLRKSHQPVLAVLLVQSADDREKGFRLYRGTNMEVSMPTGSLCAERNAIGSALAMNPQLQRHDLKLIAVLAVPPVEAVEAEKNESNVAAAGTTLRHVTSYSSIVEEAWDDRRHHSFDRRKSSIGSDPDAPTEAAMDMNASVCSSVGGGDMTTECTVVEPVRRIPLFPRARHPTKRTVVVRQSQKDRNPLPPCGACNEWLKKIAQSNPYFKILTFTDAQCNGIYISSCQD